MDGNSYANYGFQQRSWPYFGQPPAFNLPQMNTYPYFHPYNFQGQMPYVPANFQHLYYPQNVTPQYNYQINNSFFVNPSFMNPQANNPQEGNPKPISKPALNSPRNGDLSGQRFFSEYEVREITPPVPSTLQRSSPSIDNLQQDNFVKQEDGPREVGVKKQPDNQEQNRKEKEQKRKQKREKNIKKFRRILKGTFDQALRSYVIINESESMPHEVESAPENRRRRFRHLKRPKRKCIGTHKQGGQIIKKNTMPSFILP